METPVKVLRNDLLIDIFEDDKDDEIIIAGNKIYTGKKETKGKENPGTVGVVKKIADDLRNRKNLGLDIGSQVLFDKYAGTMIKIEGKQYLVLDYDEVLGVLL